MFLDGFKTSKVTKALPRVTSEKPNGTEAIMQCFHLKN